MIASTNHNASLSLVAQDIQWLLVISCVIIIGASVLLYKWMNDSSKTNRKVSIKIDKNGKYHYQTDEQAGNSKLLFWVKVILIVIAGIIALLPFKELIVKD